MTSRSLVHCRRAGECVLLVAAKRIGITIHVITVTEIVPALRCFKVLNCCWSTRWLPLSVHWIKAQTIVLLLEPGPLAWAIFGSVKPKNSKTNTKTGSSIQRVSFMIWEGEIIAEKALSDIEPRESRCKIQWQIWAPQKCKCFLCWRHGWSIEC